MCVSTLCPGNGTVNVDADEGRLAEILAYLMKEKVIDGNTLTVTGKTLGENVDRWTHKHGELEFTRQDVIRPLSKPIKETGHIRYEGHPTQIPLFRKVTEIANIHSESSKEISHRGVRYRKSPAKKVFSSPERHGALTMRTRW